MADPWKACSNRWCRLSCLHRMAALGRHFHRSCAKILYGAWSWCECLSQVSACLVSSVAWLRRCQKTAASRVILGHMLPECSDEVTHIDIVQPAFWCFCVTSLIAGLPKCSHLCRLWSGAWSRLTAMLPVPANLGALAHCSSFSWRDPCPSSHPRALHKNVYCVVLLDLAFSIEYLGLVGEKGIADGPGPSSCRESTRVSCIDARQVVQPCQSDSLGGSSVCTHA